MLEIVPPTSSNTAIVTLAIGSEYEKSWQRHALPGWLEYCKKNGIGLYVQTENLDTSENPKKKQWQKLLFYLMLVERESRRVLLVPLVKHI